jgi:hypothetical protein
LLLANIAGIDSLLRAAWNSVGNVLYVVQRKVYLSSLFNIIGAKLSAIPLVTWELASSTAVSRAVLGGEEGTSESTSVSLMVVIARWEGKKR